LQPVKARRLPDLLQSPYAAVRLFGLAAFRRLGPGTGPALRPLWPRLLEDESSAVRAEALSAIEGVPGGPGPEGVARLPRLLGEDASEVKRSALIALAGLNGQGLPPGIPALLSAGLTDPEWELRRVRDEAVAAVRSLPGDTARALLAELIGWLRRP